MMSGGDAAEQVVRLSLEGIEVAAKITGEGAKNIAILLAAVLKEEHKTKGKARLTNMIRSGKELKVFSVQNKDLKKFSQEAKRYGVLYCVLKDKDNKSDFATVDVIARAEDAAKIQRIMERFELAKIDKASVVSEVTKDRAMRMANPDMAKTEKSPLSEPHSKNENRSAEGAVRKEEKPSVRAKLNEFKVVSDRKKGEEKVIAGKANRTKVKER